MTTVGTLVRDKMKELSITQAQLAGKIGKDQTLIARFLSGTPVAETTARCIASELGLDASTVTTLVRWSKLNKQLERLSKQYADILGEQRICIVAQGA